MPPWRGQQRLACLIIVAVGAVVACIPRGDPPIGGIIAVVGVVLWIGLELHGLWLRQKRRWLKIAENGFEIYRGEDQRWYEDRHVTGLACSHHSVLINGTPSGTLRRFQVWLVEEHRPLVMENVFPLGEPDPLAGFIHRLVEVAMERARQTIRDGGAIAGVRWRLDGLEFSPRGGRPIAVSDLSAVGEYDGRICVWRRGHPKAIFKTRADSRNSIVLLTLLQTWLKERTPVALHESRERESLGRLLFQRRVGYILPSILLTIGASIQGAGLFFPDPFMFAVPAAVFAGVGLCMLLGGGSTFRCHERGVLCRGVLMKRALLYSDVASLTYAETQLFRNGAYVGTKIELAIIPSPGSDGRPIEFGITRNRGDAEFDKLRDFVSVAVARQMADRWTIDGEVPWTQRIMLRSDGFEYRAPLVVGRKKPVFIPYASCERFELAKGVFKVFAASDNQPVITEKTSAHNFYPGYFLLLEKLGRLPLMAQLHP